MKIMQYITLICISYNLHQGTLLFFQLFYEK